MSTCTHSQTPDLTRSGESDWRPSNIGWLAYWGITLGLLVVSYAYTAAGGTGGAGGVGALGTLVLAKENNAAAWWSGMALLAGGVVAASVAIPLWGRDRLGALAFAGLALLMLGLTMDEVGSLHERVGVLLPWGNHGGLVPFALAGGGVLAFSLVVLWSRPRREAFPGCWLRVLAAFGLFGTVYGQEVIEHRVAWPEGLRALRLVVEEGTELAAMALVLWAMVSAGRSIGRRAAERRADLTGALLAVGGVTLVATPPLLMLSHAMGPEGYLPHWGHFWTTPLAVLLALGAWQCGVRAREAAGPGARWLIPGALLLALSLDAVAHLELTWGWLTRANPPLIVAMGLPVVAAFLLVFDRGERWRTIGRAAAIPLAALGALESPYLASVAAATMAAGVLLATLGKVAVPRR